MTPHQFVATEVDLRKRLGSEQLDNIVRCITDIVRDHNLQYTPETLRYLFDYVRQVVISAQENT